MKHAQKNIRSAAVRAIVEQAASKTDPMGSYTGRPCWKTVKPRCRTQTICKARQKKAAPSGAFGKGGLLLQRQEARSALQLAAQ